MKRNLVILTTHFGTNYSGGSTATCEIFSRIASEFSSITVLGTVLGEHGFDCLDFVPIRCVAEAKRYLRLNINPEMILYGDFYNAIAYQQCGLPFFFTYHDNWPELGRIAESESSRDRWHWPAYQAIFRSAKHVFTVSEFKKKQVRHFNQAVSLVLNGVDIEEEASITGKRADILMVGNIDYRKYGMALKVFDRLAEHYNWTSDACKIDIYGHVHERDLLERLTRFPFVRYLGYQSTIPYSKYKICLHTSVIENLSLVWCEAIASGVPVVTFDVGGASEVINESTGIGIAPYDVDQMCLQLLRLLDADLVVDSGSIVERFSWDAAAQQYLTTLYDSRSSDA